MKLKDACSSSREREEVVLHQSLYLMHSSPFAVPVVLLVCG